MVSVRYGKREEIFNLKVPYNVITAKPAEAIRDVTGKVKQVLDAPSGTLPFQQLFSPGESVVIIVSDITRLSLHNERFLPIILNELNAAGIPDRDISIVTATGDHRPHTCEEHQLLLGEKVSQRVKVLDHNCHADDLAYLGETSRGTKVWINRTVYNADKVILTGGISYHPLAGFGGGRKSVCPGVCGYETIQQNHCLALNAVEGEVETGILDKNPVALDMVQVTAMLKPDFLLNVVVNEHGEYIGIVGGHWRKAFLEGTKIVEEAFGIEISERASVVIASCGGYPKDIQLYQAIKTLINAYYASTEEGTIVLVAECSDGAGSDDYLSWFDFGNYHHMAAQLGAHFTMPGHVALLTAKVARERTVYLVSGLNPGLVKKVGFKPAVSVDEALEQISKNKETDFIHIMPYGSITVPICRQ